MERRDRFKRGEMRLSVGSSREKYVEMAEKCARAEAGWRVW